MTPAFAADDDEPAPGGQDPSEPPDRVPAAGVDDHVEQLPVTALGDVGAVVGDDFVRAERTDR